MPATRELPVLGYSSRHGGKDEATFRCLPAPATERGRPWAVGYKRPQLQSNKLKNSKKKCPRPFASFCIDELMAVYSQVARRQLKTTAVFPGVLVSLSGPGGGITSSGQLPPRLKQNSHKASRE